MDRLALLEFMRSLRVAAVSSLSADGAPQAAVIGIGVSERFELVFDTLASSRKAQNLRRDPRVALLLGGFAEGEVRTVQYEGLADEPSGAELERLKAIYYSAWPEEPSRLSWPGLIYVRVRPSWIRYSDFSQSPPLIVEWTGLELG